MDGPRLILILGGARSGKSSHAERLAGEMAGAAQRVCYIATATPLDEEMARRIARHRQERPAAWTTIEEPLALGAALAAAQAGGARVVLVDCLTLWFSNLLFGIVHDIAEPPDEDAATAIARNAADALLAAHRAGAAGTVLVSNEVGLGLVPPYPSGRLYRDTLGRLNAWLAAEADEVYLLVAGLPLRHQAQPVAAPSRDPPGAGC